LSVTFASYDGISSSDIAVESLFVFVSSSGTSTTASLFVPVELLSFVLVDEVVLEVFVVVVLLLAVFVLLVAVVVLVFVDGVVEELFVVEILDHVEVVVEFVPATFFGV